MRRAEPVSGINRRQIGASATRHCLIRSSLSQLSLPGQTPLINILQQHHRFDLYQPNTPLPRLILSPMTRPAGVRQVFDFWKHNMKPGGFKFDARIINYPGGKPGDVGCSSPGPRALWKKPDTSRRSSCSANGEIIMSATKKARKAEG